MSLDATTLKSATKASYVAFFNHVNLPMERGLPPPSLVRACDEGAIGAVGVPLLSSFENIRMYIYVRRLLSTILQRRLVATVAPRSASAAAQALAAPIREGWGGRKSARILVAYFTLRGRYQAKDGKGF